MFYTAHHQNFLQNIHLFHFVVCQARLANTFTFNNMNDDWWGRWWYTLNNKWMYGERKKGVVLFWLLLLFKIYFSQSSSLKKVALEKQWRRQRGRSNWSFIFFGWLICLDCLPLSLIHAAGVSELVLQKASTHYCITLLQGIHSGFHLLTTRSIILRQKCKKEYRRRWWYGWWYVNVQVIFALSLIHFFQL